MRPKDKLYQTLDKIDNQGYKSYKKLQKNWYDFEDFKLGIPYVQGDPYARPSSIFIRISADKAEFKDWYLENETRVRAVEDFLTRKISKNISKYVKGHRGSGKSGLIAIARPGQRQQEKGQQFPEFSGRIPAPDSFNPRKGRKIKDFKSSLPSSLTVIMFCPVLRKQEQQ